MRDKFRCEVCGKAGTNYYPWVWLDEETPPVERRLHKACADWEVRKQRADRAVDEAYEKNR